MGLPSSGAKHNTTDNSTFPDKLNRQNCENETCNLDICNLREFCIKILAQMHCASIDIKIENENFTTN